jgi:hypothetical protein
MVSNDVLRTAREYAASSLPETLEVLRGTYVTDELHVRVRTGWDVLRTVRGIVVQKRADRQFDQAAGKPVRDQEWEIVCDYAADLSGAEAYREKGSRSVWEPVNDNLGSSYRIVTILDCRGTTV